MYAAILAGGSGTRLWPHSRQAQPKQFADITGSGRTMIQATADRLHGLVATDQLYVVVGEQHAAMTAAQLPQLAPKQLIIEPSGRNTGPAIGLACIQLYHRDPQAVVAILPADHVILDAERFRAALRQADAVAQQGFLVTLGITPDFPHTGYGYIKQGTQLLFNESSDLAVYEVERFLEKPNRTTAESFLSEGGYYWNGGIFIARVDRLLAEFARQQPEFHAVLQRILHSLGMADAAQVLATEWPKTPKLSIDYAIMEHAERLAMVPLQAGWNDVGSWDALAGVLTQDADSNFIARGATLSIESKGNIVYSNKRVVALIGVDDLVLVETDDALLVGHKAQMQKVKEVVEQLRKTGRAELL